MKTEEGTMHEGKWWPSEVGKGKEMLFPPKSQKQHSPASTMIPSSKTHSRFLSSRTERRYICAVEASKFEVLYCSSGGITI